jgi:hypothetical protein
LPVDQFKRVFSTIGEKTDAKKCPAMFGMVEQEENS